MQNTQLTEAITDPNHPLIEHVRALSERAHRDLHEQYLVEGIRFVLSAETAHASFHTILYSKRLLTSGAGKACLKRMRRRGVPIIPLGADLFRAISSTRRASGLAAIMTCHARSLEQVDFSPPHAASEPAPGPWLGVRHLDSAGNLGSIIRTVEATRASGVICFGKSIDPFDPASVRASMGTLLHVDLVRTTHGAMREVRARADVAIYGASIHGERAVWDVDLTKPCVIMLGNERHGLTAEEVELCDELVSIPMGGHISSLNAAVAASMMLYESWRQRRPE